MTEPSGYVLETLWEVVRMRESPRTPLIAYSVAVLGTAVCLLARWPLWPVLGDLHPYLTCLPAIFISAYFGGWRPGLLAVLLGALGAQYFLIEPYYSFVIEKVIHVGLTAAIRKQPADRLLPPRCWCDRRRPGRPYRRR
jgi:K+-sensing histidine kinase KdpD